MKEKQFERYRRMLTAVVGMVVAGSVVAGIWQVPIITVAFGLVAMFMLRSRVTDVIEDERVHRIGEKAARKAFSIFGLGGALVGGVLIALRDAYPQFELVGYTLTASICVLLVLYMIFYWHYNRKGIK